MEKGPKVVSKLWKVVESCGKLWEVVESKSLAKISKKSSGAKKKADRRREKKFASLGKTIGLVEIGVW